MLAGVSPADEALPQLELTISAEGGIITGAVLNASDKPVKVNANHLYGLWQHTTVLYLHSDLWHEATLIKKERFHFGTMPPKFEVLLAPGETLRSSLRSVV